MQSAALIDSASAAFIAGLVTSPHCVGMCGPIGCATLPLGQSESSLAWATASYHLCRSLAYMIICLLAGLIGGSALDAFGAAPAKILPWLMVAMFLAVAFRLDRHLPKPRAWSGLFQKISRKVRALPRWLLGAGLGAMTPLLPCGPLYLIFTVALFSGDPVRGAEIGLAFALGTIPLLALAQGGYFRYKGKFSPTVLRWVQCVFALAAAGLITYRMIASDGLFGEQFCH
ncbi:sulfite exporter TauE/SafE family protein [Cerasicoccus fimbriatus]|uniref:sulfite exporter TauE/SafE family protein n=1 Tax=Cerasicoccus fimbriatus TaxID=3014554 RepID=UPI0022B2FC8C|nr:sulfite exporter TauE/SafE family protein [Cerasicoccus sp. TK19100]